MKFLIRQYLRSLIIGFVLLLSVGTKAQKDTLSVLHITDTHVIFKQSIYIPEMMEYRKKKQYDQGEERLRYFLETVPHKTASDLVVATGDLVDFFETEIDNGSSLAIQPAQFSKLLKDYPIPILLTLGNHDVFSFEWDDNKEYKLLHNQDHTGRARALWTRTAPSFSNGTYYSKIMEVGKTTYRFIFLDDSFYKFSSEDTSAQTPYLGKPQLYWLKDQLNRSDQDVEIIFMHIPFSTKKNSKTNNEFYSLLTENISSKLILSGHHHKNIIKKIPSVGGQEIIQVQTDALVEDADNWRLLKFTENEIFIFKPGKMDIEMTVNIN